MERRRRLQNKNSKKKKQKIKIYYIYYTKCDIYLHNPDQNVIYKKDGTQKHGKANKKKT